MTEFFADHALLIVLAGSLLCWTGVFLFLLRMDRALKHIEDHLKQG
ncbi:MAG TPA: hypothetical protein VMW43_11870 [Bacteroidota bacterium]|nr:hypothetical protein [Bacteroidota bacterium]